VFFAGQISGVEGYVESIATGLLAGVHLAAHLCGEQVLPLPRETALGSLCPLHLACGSEKYQAGEYCVRPVPAAGESIEGAQGASDGNLPAGVGRSLTNTWPGRLPGWSMSELESAIAEFMGELARRNDSPHTLRNYDADLREFRAYFSPPDTEPPVLGAFDCLHCASGWRTSTTRAEASHHSA